jgi:hypothetical protein
MTVNKGLTSLIDSDPNLSNQALENAINELKIGWVVASIELDTAITDNTVLSTSQKNDVKNTINNIAYLNVGRYLNDMIRHTNTILDGSIMPFDASVETKTFTFIEALQTVDALQTTIPDLFGVPASSKSRSVNNHFGILNNMFTAVFTSMKEAITFINAGDLAQDTEYQTALTDLKNFIASVVGDSTDFQQTLNTFASAVAMTATAFDSPLQLGEYASRRTQLISDRNSIVTQQTLENSNIISLRTYIETITNNDALAGLAENKDMRDLLTNVSQNTTWQKYYNDYETNVSNINPIYEISTDSDKSSVINAVLQSRGLPDVTDYLDFPAVAKKATRDNRIDVKDYEFYSIEQIITKSCEQLGIITANRIIQDQSNTLLNNMNDNDRAIVANELDLNESTNTLS